MNLVAQQRFKKAFKRLIKKNPPLKNKILDVLDLLEKDIFTPSLKSHKLTGNLANCWSCSVSMEKADYSLEDELKKGKLSEENVKLLVLDIVNGLDYLHRQNPVIVHRDLKPGNILRVGDNKFPPY